MNQKRDPIGVFDSGAGGISTLREMIRELPKERFIYYGDAANAPYGTRSTEEVTACVRAVVNKLLQRNIKALVIACNTATAAAAPILRGRYIYTPIICVEPAIKQASIEHPTDDILVMATSATLKLEKFNKLKDELSHRAKIISLPCSGLVDLIEQGNLSNPQIKQYLVEKITPYKTIKAIVLGCTHYPFIEKQIKSIMPQTDIYNSTTGTAMELRRQLIKAEILNKTENIVSPVFLSSSNNVELMQKFFESK